MKANFNWATTYWHHHSDIRTLYSENTSAQGHLQAKFPLENPFRYPNHHLCNRSQCSESTWALGRLTAKLRVSALG
jgi:hypothetical protein